MNIMRVKIKKKLFKLIVTLTIVILFILMLQHYNLFKYLGINGFSTYNSYFLNLKFCYPIAFIVTFFGLYVILIILCIPGTIAFDLIAGFIWGALWGSVIVVISYLVGAILNFIFVKYIFRKQFENRFHKFKYFISGHDRNSLLMNLIGLRLVAVIPFWVINIAAAMVNVSIRDFIISTFLGILPTSIIYSFIGAGVRDSIANGGELSTDILLNYKIWSPLLILGLMLLIPNFIKHFKKKY